MRHRHPDHVRSSLLAQRAAQMRYQLNPAEAALWAEINAGKLGVVFRRQVVALGRYIADFLAPPEKVIVEVDGSHHARRVSVDARRDERCAACCPCTSRSAPVTSQPRGLPRVAAGGAGGVAGAAGGGAGGAAGARARVREGQALRRLALSCCSES
jgi:hypothetical protein